MTEIAWRDRTGAEQIAIAAAAWIRREETEG